MNLSSASTAASSEPYANMDPAQDAQTKGMQPPVEFGHRPPRSHVEAHDPELKHSLGPGMRSKTSNEPQGPKASGSDGTLTTPGEMIDFSGTSSGKLIRKSHKRKRDDDVDYSHSIQGGSSCADPVGPLPYPNRTENVLPRVANDVEALMDESSSQERTTSDDFVFGPTARVKYSSRCRDLPIEIWQRVFCFVPPVFLGRLLRVNRAFNTYLTAGDTNQQYSKPSPSGKLKALNPDTVWAASRKRFCPGLPKPIRGLLELEMWRLLRGRHCQKCGEVKDASSNVNSESPWELGPGATGVRVIWPWGVRICGQCVQTHSEKEIDLLFSSDSSLLSGLPFAFISLSNNYVTSLSLRSAAPPSTLQLFKRFYKSHIDEIRTRLNDARELGKPSAEEWFKGLEMEGKERLDDVVRWEQWEAKGGLKKVNQPPHVKPISMTGHATVGIKIDVQKAGANPDRSIPMGGLRLPVKPIVEPDASAMRSLAPLPNIQPSLATSFQPPWAISAPYSDGIHQRHPAQVQTRPERSIREVNEAKANRRLEIERRCAALDPPVLANVLAHMEAFQAAIQISQPLNDQAWQVLKPRLLIQRAYAERRENDRATENHLLQAEHKHRRLQEAQIKETRDNLDREWESIQMPIRTQLMRLAEERIETHWAGGKSVTKDNCPQFAADVLLYVRGKFYDEVSQEDGTIGTISETTKSDSADRSASRILILENMKWLFDYQIKPWTEKLQKELFLCNGCDGNFKFYGLESVVQHYAAKHTTSLSLGNQVVHWRAEWPEHPPFHPEPSVAKAAYYKIPTPIMTSLQGPPGRDPELFNHFGVFGQRPSQELNGMPYFSAEPHKGPYRDIGGEQQGQQSRNYSPSLTQDYPYFSSGEAQSQSFYSNHNFGHAYPGPQNSHNVVISNHGVPTSISEYISPSYNPHFPVSSYAEQPERPDHRNLNWYGSELSGHQHAPVPMASRYPNIPLRSLNSHLPHSDSAQIGQSRDTYQRQVEEMAQHAQDVWSATSGIKDIPQSVRIFVVIHETTYRFRAIYATEPNLAMFIDGLNNNDLMRPIRSLKGLSCKQCVTSDGGNVGGQFAYAQLPVGYRSLHTLPQLLDHFKRVHVESSRYPFDGRSNVNPGPDWKIDMIELPEIRLITDLINAPGIDDTKLELLAKSFPAAFPSPLPRRISAESAGPTPIYTGGLDTRERPLQRAMPEIYSASPSRLDHQYESQPLSRPFSSFRETSQRTHSSEPPGEDEYDPHRPADGLPSTHSRKSIRLSPTLDGQLDKSTRSHQNHPFTLPDIADSSELPRSPAPLGTFPGEDSSSRHRPQGEDSHHSLPSEGAVDTLSEDRYDDRRPDHPKQRAHGEPDEDYSHTQAVSYILAPEEQDLGENVISDKPTELALSAHEGASAADEFLDNLASTSNLNQSRNYTPIDHEENDSIVKPAERSPGKQWHRHGDMAPKDRSRKIGSTSLQRQETDFPSISSRPNSGRSNYDEGQPSVAEHNYNRRSRSGSRIPRTANGRRVGRSSDIYSTFEATPGAIIRERYEMGGNIMESSRIRDSSFHATRTSRYRSRSRSPRPIPVPVGTTYYRTRSPGGRVFEPVYQVRSPHPQRIISYEHPARDHYDYVDSHRPPERQYRQRVEYVPVRVGEHASVDSGRYVIAQSPDLRPPPDYVRIKRDYDGDAMYEHHGQVYHTDSRSYHVQPNFGPLASGPGYRY